MDGAVDRVVVMGLMGVGKTTVGRLLAARLGWRFSDSDAQIEATEHVRARELHAARGLDALHRLEADHLRGALAAAGPLVIAAAASTIDDERCRAALAAPRVLAVWLRGDPALLAGRISPLDHRPLLDADMQRVLTEQSGRRSQRFAELDAFVVDVAGRSADEIVDAIVARLGDPAAR